MSRVTYFNIRHGGPPGRRTNRPIWQVPGSEETQSGPGHIDVDMFYRPTLL